MILGDNPGGMTEGPPLTIDWEYHREKSTDLDEYEKARKIRRRRGQFALLMSPRTRMAVLERAGFSKDDIKEEMCRTKLVRSQRSSTMSAQAKGVDKAREIYETATRRFKNVVTLGRSSRSERKLLEPYASAQTV